MPFDEVDESTRLRALGHPLRLRILELLATSGPLTATEVGDRVDSSPSNCSFHLRMLHRAGFIEEVAEATGRNRPWQLVEGASQVDVNVDDLDDVARQQLRHTIIANVDRHRRHALNWLDTRDRHSQQVRNASGVRDSIMRLTPAELTAIEEGLQALMAPLVNRSDADIPGDAIPVALTFAVLPVEAPPSDAS